MKRRLLNSLAAAGLVIPVDLVNGKTIRRKPLNGFSTEFLSTAPGLQSVVRSAYPNPKLNSIRQIKLFKIAACSRNF